MKLLVFLCATIAVAFCAAAEHAEEKKNVMVEQTTKSPMAAVALQGNDVKKTNAAESGSTTKPKKENTNNPLADSQQQTIGDFIIHPLVAFKAREPAVESGKQAPASPTPASPWQFFPFNAAQGLGSSVSSLADWFGNRIQLPGLVETPVRVSSTTTPAPVKPDVIVRVKQRAPTVKPLAAISNNNNRPYRNRKKPNRYNSNYVEEIYDSNEYDDDVDFNRRRGNRRRYQDDEEFDDDYIVSNEYDDDEEEDNDKKPGNKQNNNRRRHSRPITYNIVRNSPNHRRRTNSNPQREDSAEEDQYDNYYDDEDDYYDKKPNKKRSQNELNLIQIGEQNLLDQIKHLTRIQTAADVDSSLRKAQKSKNTKWRQQATFLIKRNGEAIYVSPEVLQAAEDANNKVTTTAKKQLIAKYPQPPLTLPYKSKGQPTQYITIPWTQLGIAPPDELVALTEGLQSQPLILKIPQSAIDDMQSLEPNKKKATLTADAVPLLAEASIMDIFQPPSIPPARTPTKPTKKTVATVKPSAIAAKVKPAPTRIRPDTIVEKAPVADSVDEHNNNSDDDMEDDSQSTQYIVVGEEEGERKLSRSAYRQILNYFNQNRLGRQLEGTEHLIPVQVVSAEEETPLEQAATIKDDKLEMNSTEKKVVDEVRIKRVEP